MWVLIVFLLQGPVIVHYDTRSACERARIEVIDATNVQAACFEQNFEREARR